MVYGSGAFGRSLGRERGALMNEISAFVREPRERPCLFYHVMTRREDAIYELGRVLFPDSKLASAMILDSQSPEPREINFCCL